jgi:cell division protein FtsB
MMLAPAALLVVALALATNVLPLRQIVAQRQEISQTQATLDALVEDNETLDARVAALGTPVEIERIAREELGYIRPGETAYVVIDPAADDDSAAPTVTPESGGLADTPQPARASDGNFATRIWDFLTGRDLASTE